jgi:hypothetical protein
MNTNKTSKKTGPTAAAKKNAEAMAIIVGGVAEDVGRRCVVFTYLSKKLRNIEGSIECRDSTVTVSLVDISAPEAGALLATLVLMCEESKKAAKLAQRGLKK